MIDLLDISVQFTGKYLFENVNLKINKNEKIALVGSNGTGKSTLLKIIKGLEQPESGKIVYQKGIKIGYLPQEFVHFKGKALFEEVKSAFDFALKLDEEENTINQKLSDPSITDNIKNKLIERLGEIHHKKEEIDFYNINVNVAKVLAGLGFSNDDFERKTDEFSGGWQMRIELAKILLADNDLILLDEPTNHLDIDTLQWVINFLNAYRGSLIVISHDRYFVNQVTDKTLEIFNRKVSFYNGNYESYLRFKEERDKQLKDQLKKREREVKQLNKFIERFRYKATKASQVQSRIKMLEKMEELDLPEDESTIDLRFPEPPRSGAVPIELTHLSKSYGDNLVLKNIDLQIERGEKLAFVGPNGAGKTTLSKIIANKLEPTEGEVKIGHNTLISYYAQEVAESLNPENDMLDTLSEVNSELNPGSLRTILGSFLFSDDDVFKKIKVLSGGEKSRIALAKILIQKANLIILDEPTNHLDFNSKKVLQNALINFTGALVIVSHDIDFIRPIVDKVFEIRDHKVNKYFGGIDYYIAKKKDEEDKHEESNTNQPQTKNSRKEEKRLLAELRQQKYRETKELKKNLENLEEEIANLEEEKQNYESKLADPSIYSNSEKAKETKVQYEQIKDLLESNYEKWSELSEELEEIEDKYENHLSKNS